MRKYSKEELKGYRESIAANRGMMCGLVAIPLSFAFAAATGAAIPVVPTVIVLAAFFTGYFSKKATLNDDRLTKILNTPKKKFF
jgi:MFS superfamily sulfate permease-like transporter